MSTNERPALQQKHSMNSLSGRDDSYTPDSKSLTEFGLTSQKRVRPDRLMSPFPGKKTGQPPPPISRTAFPQTKACGERPNHNFATSPPSTHSHKAAHLGSGLDVPDLHESVVRRADDASAVPRESDGPFRVTRQRMHLPPPTSDHFQDKIQNKI